MSGMQARAAAILAGKPVVVDFVGSAGSVKGGGGGGGGVGSTGSGMFYLHRIGGRFVNSESLRELAPNPVAIHGANRNPLVFCFRGRLDSIR
jgi:hypothetical protein